jgi:hypothetical protein
MPRTPKLAALVEKLDELWTMDSRAKFAVIEQIRAALGKLPASDAVTVADNLTYRVEGFALDSKKALHRTAVKQLANALKALTK